MRTSILVLLSLIFHLDGGRSFAGTERLPVVYVHGIGIPTSYYEQNEEFKQTFAKFGRDLYIVRFSEDASLDTQVLAIKEQLKTFFPNNTQRFHLIGKSMGGLSARLAVHRYGLGGRVVSLTTIATPHRGSEAADWVMKHIRHRCLKGKALAVVLGSMLTPIQELTTDQWVNRSIPDDSRVQYFSMGFYIPAPANHFSHNWVLRFMNGRMIKAGQTWNDGLVSIDSARWGKSLGLMEGDHFAVDLPYQFGEKTIFQDVFHRVLSNLEALELVSLRAAMPRSILDLNERIQ